MLTVLLKVLSILGMILLVLLGILLAAVLAVLFLPVTYRLEASRYLAEQSGTAADAGDAEDGEKFLIKARLRANWLFGLLRVRFSYPEPGKLIVRLLWFKVFDPSKQDEEKDKKKDQKRKEKRKKGKKPEAETAQTELRTDEDGQVREAAEQAESAPQPQEPASQKQKENIITKIKCTIQRICDKIKKIREDIAFYRELLLCDDTRGLIEHAFRRLGKILKSIRPRKLKADIRFGTGSPDTTGYALGIYGMLSPHLGRHVNVTPDFMEAVFEGEVFAAGHITVFQLLLHGGKLVFDRRLRELRKKLKERDTGENG